jgi:nucleoside diphosphate kinase
VKVNPANDETWAFALITPDGVVSQATEFVAGRFLEHGLEIGACRLLSLDSERMFAVYSDPEVGPTGPSLPAHIFEDLYREAPACLLMVRQKQPGGERTCDLLNHAKGATDPQMAAVRSVRAAGENKIMNLIHSPDDSRGAWRELCLLVGENEAQALIRLTFTGGGQAALVSLDGVMAAMPAFSGWQAISFPLVANRLEQRIVQRLSLVDESGVDELTAVQTELRKELEELTSLPTSGTRLDAAKAWRPTLHEPLLTVAERCDESGLVDALNTLDALFYPEREQVLEPVTRLPEHRVPLTSLEQVSIVNHRWSFAYG